MGHQLNGLSLVGETKSKIITLLRERERTAPEVARSLDIQVSAARKHLESMVDLGIADHRYVSEGVGRPKKVFALTESASELFPNQYSNILNLFLSRMIQSGDSGQVQALMEQVAEDMGRELRAEIGSSKEMRHISSALDRLGFQSSVERSQEKGELVITSTNCPIFKVASKHHNLVCDHIHDQLLKSALDTDEVERKKCVFAGDRVCTHVVKLP